MARFTKDERRVFDHIAAEDVTPVGAVEGDAFRHLLALGVVEVHGDGASLSEYGWELRSDEQANSRDAAELSDLDT